MSDNKMYDILGKFNNLAPQLKPVTDEDLAQPVYEAVEPKGDIMEAVRGLEEKYSAFKKEEKEYCDACDSAECHCESIEEGAKPDFLDLDKDGDTEEPMKAAAKDAKDTEPAKPDSDAVAKRKRLQALKDKQEDERAEKGDDYKSSSRFVKGRAYGGAAQKDDEDKDLDEVAPPGAKAERMVKHIKKGYAKDGNLTKKEKGIAYATAWKAHNKGQVEESLTESRNSVMEGSSYTYEKIADILSQEQPGLDTNSKAFEKAVYDELIKMHLSPKAARWNVYYDEDFLSDCATAYAHNLKQQAAEVAELSMNTQEPLLDAVQELDEIARLAGLPTKTCEACDCDPCKCDESVGCSMEELDEAATRKDFRMVADLIKNIPDYEKRKELAQHHANIFKQQNPRFKQDVFCKACGLEECDWNMNPTLQPVMGEETMDEGNEYTKARLDAIAAGKDTFTVGGKEHKVTGDTTDEKAQVESVDDEKQAVTEDINVSINANGEQDVVALIQKLAGMPVVAVAPQSEIAVAEEVVEEERDIEWDNTPEEKIAPLSAAIPSGTDLHKSKLQDPHTANKAANPLGEEKVEESLWTAYEEMINDLKA